MELNWSRWFRCESSFGLLLVPNQPGVFALAEEVVQPAGPQSRRMLAVFEIDETQDLVRSLSRLFTAASQWRERLATARCYVRYAAIPDKQERGAAATSLKNWLNSQRDTATQIFEPGAANARPLVDEETAEIKTVAERAVDRVTRGRSAKAVPAGF